MLHSVLRQFHRAVLCRTRACYSTNPEQPRLPTISEVRERLFEQTSSLFFDRKSERPEGPPPKTQDELPERTIKESKVAATVPLGSDPAIRDQYRSFLGKVRVGRLMEDMDLFSVWAARAFLRYPPGHFALVVTVFVDEFEFTPLMPQPDQDIRLRGRVTWTGKTTLETEILMEQQGAGDWRVLTKAFFVMAVRTPRNKPMAVNRLRPTTPAEEKMILAGNERRQRRARLADDKSLLQAPTSQEYAMLHRIFLATVADPEHSPACLHERPRRPGCLRLCESRLTASIFAHPIDRNMYNTVFGGYIMRMATELSHSNTYMICHESPVLRYISYMAFRRPIHMGSLMILHSLMSYTEDNFEQMQVCVDVMDPKSGVAVTTNVVYLTYQTEHLAPLIYPDSYSECLVYLEGRRQFVTAAKAIGGPRGTPLPAQLTSSSLKNVGFTGPGYKPSVPPPVAKPPDEGDHPNQ